MLNLKKSGPKISEACNFAVVVALKILKRIAINPYSLIKIYLIE